MGCIKGGKHKIQLTTNKHVAAKPYRIPNKLLPAVRKHIEELLQKGIIRPSSSPHASPAFPLVKFNGDRRLLIDFRRLNAITTKNPYLNKRVDDLLYHLQGSRVFTSLYLKKKYYQLEVGTEDIEKTSFVLPFGHFEFLRMPFGLVDAPMTFQSAMDVLFADLEFLSVYLDDILIHSSSLEMHYEHLKQEFERLALAGISLNWDKCQFLREELF